MAQHGMRRGRRGSRGALLTAAVAAAVWLLGGSFSSSVFLFAGSPRTVPRQQLVARPARGGEVDARVNAQSPDDQEWYPGLVEAVNDDGTFTVRWDDPDGGPETVDLPSEALEEIKYFKDYAVGDDVKAMPPDDSNYYPGNVVAANDDGTFKVRWDDADGGPEEQDIKAYNMKKVTIFKDYKAGEDVDARYPEDGNWYAATVSKANGDGTFVVKWEDPDEGPEESTVSYKEMHYPPIPLDQLEVGKQYRGVVKTVMDFGAFIDIGAEVDGLLHISRIAEERIDNIRDYVTEEQEVDVWVAGVRDDGKFGLTMIEGKLDGPRRADTSQLEAFTDLDPDEFHDGVVMSAAPFGAFIRVTLEGGEQAEGLAHISQLKDGFVDAVTDVVQEGQEVKVRVVSVDMDSRRMSLSLRPSVGGVVMGGAPGARERQDLEPFVDVASDQWLAGTVARIAPFGAFVTVDHPDGEHKADGLVHITQVREGFIERLEDELEVGQHVDVWIQNVDAETGKMSLSMRVDE